MTVETRPLVSICMPTRNAERWIGGAIDSALGQTWTELELVIVDNASSDSTLAVARSFSDPRVRIEANPVDVGAIPNHNRAIEHARGAYVKFLHADDTLSPTCVEEMVTLAMEDPRIGLVFSPREVVVEGDDTEWATTYATPHASFSFLERDNDGRRLFRELLDASFEHNWIGEPSAVMVTRRALEVNGLFNIHLRQRADLDLWVRILIAHRVGFIDKPLCTYRHHSASVTATNQRLGRDWLDRLWLFESILGSAGLEPAERRKLERLRRAALRRAARSQLRRVATGRFDLQLAAYARHRAVSTITSLLR